MSAPPDTLADDLEPVRRELALIREAIEEAGYRPGDTPDAIVVRLLDALEQRGMPLPLDSGRVR